MTSREDVIACLANFRDDLHALAEAASDSAWAGQTYEDGWTARDVLSHIASTSGAANFILMMARAGPSGAPGGAAFDNDAFNRQQVAMRAGRSVAEVLDEVRSNIARDVQAVQGAPDDLLQQHFRAPWDVEGTVAEVIVTSVNGHLGGHVADLRGALTT
jgi:uncharacterized protein (TIGR03083 family)